MKLTQVVEARYLGVPKGFWIAVFPSESRGFAVDVEEGDDAEWDAADIVDNIEDGTFKQVTLEQGIYSIESEVEDIVSNTEDSMWADADEMIDTANVDVKHAIEKFKTNTQNHKFYIDTEYGVRLIAIH